MILLQAIDFSKTVHIVSPEAMYSKHKESGLKLRQWTCRPIIRLESGRVPYRGLHDIVHCNKRTSNLVWQVCRVYNPFTPCFEFSSDKIKTQNFARAYIMNDDNKNDKITKIEKGNDTDINYT